MGDKLQKAGRIGGGNSNIGSGRGDIDPSWIPNGDVVTNETRPGI